MTTNKIFAVVGALAALVAVVVGLYVGGAPNENRLLRLDDRRIRDLQFIASQIDAYWEANDALPRDLDELVAAQRMRDVPVDPGSGQRYDYEMSGADGYRLCATFDRPSRAAEDAGFWEHGVGQQCFRLCRGRACP